MSAVAVPPPAFVFDAETHTYTLDGRRLISLTEALHVAGFISGEEWFTEEARLRGSAVHAACWYFDERDFNESTLDPRIRPYLDAWKRFREESGWAAENTDESGRDTSIKEEPLWSFEGFATTPDRVGELGGHPTILEIKTGLESPWHGPQTAGQAIARSERTGRALHTLRRYGVYLRNDGTYRLRPKTDRGDYAAFRAALTVALWKGLHG